MNRRHPHFGSHRRREFCLWLFSILFLVVFTGTSTAQTAKEPKPSENPTPAKTPDLNKPTAKPVDQKEYQNQQRASHLLLLKSDIKSLEDAPMRCKARLEIVRFIFDNDVRNEFDSADQVGIDFFEDIANNADQFNPEDADRTKNFMLSLLRQKSPVTAKMVEKKYLGKTDSSVADLMELERESNTKEIADRTIAKISRSEVSNYVLSLHAKIRLTDPNSADRILDVLLGYFERTADTKKFAILLSAVESSYCLPSTPVSLKKRYVDFVVNRARLQINEVDTGQTALYILGMIKRVLPVVQETVPALYAEAQGLFVVLDAKLNRKGKDWDEATARIDASDDKLQQTIAEADAANDKELKNWLYERAALMAVESGKFRLAVDLVLKAENGSNSSSLGSDMFLQYKVVQASLKVKDFESCDYAIKKINDETRSASSMLKVGAKYIELKDKIQAFVYLEKALKLLEKGDADEDKFQVISSAISTALAVDKTKGFEVADRAIKIANHLPTPSAEAKLGSPRRIIYAEEILMPVAFELIPAFKALAIIDVPLTDSALENFQNKGWKVIAQIIVESERKYPMPKEQKKID